MQTLIIAAVALIALGGCAGGGGGADGPVPTTIAAGSTGPGEGSKLTDAQLEQLCENPEPLSDKEREATDAANDNPYAAAVQGLARAVGQLCRERET